jgi:hypothetical protein
MYFSALQPVIAVSGHLACGEDRGISSREETMIGKLSEVLLRISVKYLPAFIACMCLRTFNFMDLDCRGEMIVGCAGVVRP